MRASAAAAGADDRWFVTTTVYYLLPLLLLLADCVEDGVDCSVQVKYDWVKVEERGDNPLLQVQLQGRDVPDGGYIAVGFSSTYVQHTICREKNEVFSWEQWYFIPNVKIILPATYEYSCTVQVMSTITKYDILYCFYNRWRSIKVSLATCMNARMHARIHVRTCMYVFCPQIN